MQKVTLAAGAAPLLLSHNTACSERASVCVCDIRGHLAQQHLATNYKHTAASDYIYKNTSSVFYQCRDLYEAHSAQKFCKLPTSPSHVWISFFVAFAGRIFANSLAPNWSPRRENSSSSKRRVAAACGFFIPLETPSFLLQNLISLMMWERVGKMCFLLCTLSDNEFFSTAADTRYI
jgi:hypothetical protein